MDLLQQLQTKKMLTITTKQVESLAILQMSVLELQKEITSKLEENPVLEEQEENTDFSHEPTSLLQKYSHKELLFLAEEGSYRNQSIYQHEAPQDFLVEKTVEKTLKDQLFQQLAETNLSLDFPDIITYLIEALDSRGFLSVPLSEIAYQLQITEEKVEEALEILQEFYPYGVGCQNLAQYLSFQLQKQAEEDEALYYIAKEGLTLLAENKMKQLAKEMGKSVSQTVAYCGKIKALNPFPAAGFAEEAPHFVVPDAVLSHVGGQWDISMNEGFLPRLFVSKIYQHILKDANCQEEEKAYVREKMQQAATFIQQMQQRKQTLEKIFQAFLTLQPQYLKTGKGLLPMTLMDVAEEIDMHESTVSRAIQGKYLLTPTKLICVKDLFSSRLATGTMGEVSSTEMKREIMEIIHTENKKKPLSDQKICELLELKGFAISRRTVTKYREQMNIGSLSKRRAF